jgi:dihydroorotate dehydrogenase
MFSLSLYQEFSLTLLEFINSRILILTFIKFSTPLLNKIDPEISHKFVEIASFLNLLPQNNFQDERLEITLENENLHFPNPIGLAAGFDKNGKLFSNLHKLGINN